MADLTFKAGGRTRTLFKRYPSGPYYVRIQHEGKNVMRSTGATHVPAAKAIARHFIEELMRPLVCPTCKRPFNEGGE